MDDVAETSARLLRLLGLLQARPTWTAPALAERLEVTTRTVRRDILPPARDLGYPVDAEPGPHGGYRLGRGGSLPPLLLDDDEAVAVALGLRLAADGSVAGIDDATLSALAKLEQVLPRPLVERVRAVHGATLELRGRAQPRRRRSPGGAGRRVPPRQPALALPTATARAGTPSGWSIRTAWCAPGPAGTWWSAPDVARDAWRTLRVDRVLEVRSTGRPVEITDPPDPVALVARGHGGGPLPRRARIRLALDAERAHALVPRTIGVHHPDGPDATVVEVGGGSIEGIAGWVCGLGVDLEVLAPEALRAAVAARAARLAEAHRPDLSPRG